MFEILKSAWDAAWARHGKAVTAALTALATTILYLVVETITGQPVAEFVVGP